MPPDSEWQTASLTQTYLSGVRGAIPCAEKQIEVLLHIVSAWVPHPRTVVDLGCGDGILGRAVMERSPEARVWFVDFSAPMLAAARERVGADPRATFARADFGSSDWSAVLGDVRPDVVVSGFAIHHQEDARKRALYREVYDLLADGGVFLNLEHVASPTAAVGALFDAHFVDHLVAFHARSGVPKSREEVTRGYYARPDKAENRLAPVEAQCAWLREIGFCDVDCFFKTFELALLGGRKAAADGASPR